MVLGKRNEKKVEPGKEERYTQKFNEMSELLEMVLTMKIDYYQTKWPGNTRDEIMSLINFEILESKYKAWEMSVPVEIEDFFKKDLSRLNKGKNG